MGASGEILILKIEDKKWWRKNGFEKLKQFVQEFCKKEGYEHPWAFSPYEYENFCDVEGLDVLILYYGDSPMGYDYVSSGCVALDSEEFVEKFHDKLRQIRYYEIWT